jgi:nudix-type nucleoside diphosphatase (YffH/AdpP family)
MTEIAPQRNPRVRIRELEVLSDAWYTLRRVTFDFRGTDGTWSRQEREAYNRGNGATILLTDPARDTVLLTRQFRLPAYLNGHDDGMLLETPAGLLDGDDAETAIRREAEEETGYRIGPVTLVGELFMSPGSVTERVAFFHGSYSGNDRVALGGGVADEGEDIETIELTLAEAIALVERGEIVDAKTVLLLQWAQHRADRVTPQPRAPRMILIAGPVRGGTGDDPDLIEHNIAHMTRVALSLFERGHLPVVGEWLSLPLIAAAGSKRVGDEIYDHIQHPLAEQLLARCDGCLRIGGDSSGADHMVATARALGKPVWFSIDDVPQEQATAPH